MVGFTYNTWGKPELSNIEAPLHFNLSHSAGEALLAVSANAAVGIDIEQIRLLEEDVAGHFFTATECKALSGFPKEEQLVAFYRCWTRKEAFVKAHGEGLSVPLDSFDVALDDTDDPQLLKRLDSRIGSLQAWRLVNLDVTDGFRGALAVFSGGRDVRVNYRKRVDWSANIASMT